MCAMPRAFLCAVLAALVVVPAALADGATLSQPANGSTVSSLAPIEFTWFNPHYHVLGIRQDLYVATDPAVQKIVAEHPTGARRTSSAPRARPSMPCRPAPTTGRSTCSRGTGSPTATRGRSSARCHRRRLLHPRRHRLRLRPYHRLLQSRPATCRRSVARRWPGPSASSARAAAASATCATAGRCRCARGACFDRYRARGGRFRPARGSRSW